MSASDIPSFVALAHESERERLDQLDKREGFFVVPSVRFYLGTHEPSWLARTSVPLFISRRRLAGMKRLPKAISKWALDSGGFTELSLNGRWTISARLYVEEVRRFRDHVGAPDFAAAQDYMCEPFVREKTGLTVREHQARTVANYVELRQLAPEIPWAPVLQGWEFDDYLEHVEDYRAAGVKLEKLPVVGLGSVCRRQATGMVEDLIRELRGRGLRLHGFGFKKKGLRRVAHLLRSSDSLAWSFRARRSAPLEGCTHATCASCIRFALQWRRDLLVSLPADHQRAMFGEEAVAL